MHPIAQDTALPVGALPGQATSDDQLVDLWLHRQSEHTQRAYRAEVTAHLALAGASLEVRIPQLLRRSRPPVSESVQAWARARVSQPRLLSRLVG